MDLNQIYNRLGVDRSIKVRCNPNQVQSIRNAIHKKQSLLNGLAGREFTLKSRYDQSAGILHFWYIPAAPEFNFEIVEDNYATQVRADVGEDSSQRNGHDSLPSLSSKDTSQGDAAGSLETQEIERTSGSSEFRQDENYQSSSGGEQEQDESDV